MENVANLMIFNHKDAAHCTLIHQLINNKLYVLKRFQNNKAKNYRKVAKYLNSVHS